jgi:1-acyl-sn-glycerol-3-phosphate acyltransferase
VNALGRAVSRAHFAIAALLGGLVFLVLSLAGIAAALLSRPLARRLPLAFARAFSAFMRTALGWRLEAADRGRLAEAAPAVFVANHQSNLDIVTYGWLFPPRTVAVGKKEILKIPLFGWFFAVSGNILLDRGDPVRAHASIAEAAARMRNERISVWMFPEGHRNGSPILLPFKKGAFHLAVAAQAPIVPIVLEPMASVLAPRRGLVRPGRLRHRVLPPIPTAGRSAADVPDLVEETRRAMQAARDELAATARPAIA